MYIYICETTYVSLHGLKWNLSDGCNWLLKTELSAGSTSFCKLLNMTMCGLLTAKFEPIWGNSTIEEDYKVPMSMDVHGALVIIYLDLWYSAWRSYVFLDTVLLSRADPSLKSYTKALSNTYRWFCSWKLMNVGEAPLLVFLPHRFGYIFETECHDPEAELRSRIVVNFLNKTGRFETTISVQVNASTSITEISKISRPSVHVKFGNDFKNARRKC